MFKFKISEYPSIHPDLDRYRDVATETISNTTLEPLVRIVAVGVPFSKSGGFSRDHGEREFHHLSVCFERLLHLNIPVSPGFVFVPLDLRCGQDFFEHNQNLKPDILFYSLIADPNHEERKLWGRIKNLDIPPHFFDTPPFISLRAPHFRKSCFDKGTESWAEATEQSGAKVVISYSLGENDLNVQKFNCPDYVDASYDIPTYYGKGYTIPSRRHPILIKKDYAAQLQHT